MRRRQTLEATAAVVTTVTCGGLMLLRMCESTHPYASRRATLIGRLLDVADQYYEDAASTTDLERLELIAMSLSLVQFVQRLEEDLERIAGYDVSRRVRHLQQELNKLRVSMSTERTAADRSAATAAPS